MDSQAASEDAQAFINRLKGAGDLRVWSVIVTIMGDMARAPGETVSGTTLGALMGAMGIRPEATRVALHRLRKDGWITSERVGRGSHHALTDYGREQTLAVVDRVYGPDVPVPAKWYLVISVPGGPSCMPTELTDEGFIQIAPNTFLGATPPDPTRDLVCFSDATPRIPDWICAKILQPELQQDILDLSAALDEFSQLDTANEPSLIRAALRSLIVHRWRRIALKLPKLPLSILKPGAYLHTQINEFLVR
ncbi:PaaX family transcriptional regulator [Aliiroseovarius sp. 2305UL8-7]|uniref:PaaX family transcriptional regulator n=1 Tax=Aliiroseovarius conchicola TaxID=3121637 RepID=UPI003529C911